MSSFKTIFKNKISSKTFYRRVLKKKYALEQLVSEKICKKKVFAGVFSAVKSNEPIENIFGNETELQELENHVTTIYQENCSPYFNDCDLNNSSVNDGNDVERSIANYEDNFLHGNVHEPEATLAGDLKLWALDALIPQNHVTSLLHTLKKHNIQDIPLDARTLLSTPQKVKIQPMGSGQYWHHGIKNCLNRFFEGNKTKNIRTVKLLFNVDGIPIFNSTKKQFWPILVIISHNKIRSKPMVVGIYYGNNKPESAEIFLRPFVDDLLEIMRNGHMINNSMVGITIQGFICDSAARPLLKGLDNF